MPTETFYRLPDEKRARLTAAIRRELSRVPFADMSINRIVKDAAIPRGSYYQYFHGSDDLYAFLVADYSAKMRCCAREALTQNHGDIFAAVLAGFDVSAAFLRSREDVNALRHIVTAQPPGAPFRAGGVWNGLLNDCMEQIDGSGMRIENGESLMCMLEILLSVLQSAVMELFFECGGEETHRKRLSDKLEILRHGMLLSDGGTRA